MIAVTPEQAGTYVQIAHRLRIQRGPGRKDLVVERPRNERTNRYLEEPGAPTLITLEAGDLCDVAGLLALGAIEPRVPAATARRKGG